MVSGADYRIDFISPDQELRLVGAIDALPSEAWDTTLSRRVLHFGYRYDYRRRRPLATASAPPIPDWLMTVVERVVGPGIFTAPPDQAIINEYLPGQGIAAHIDAPEFGPRVAAISLLAPAVMLFTHPDGRRVELDLAPRSLLLLFEAARYEWAHAITPRHSDRVAGIFRRRQRRLSITLRTLSQS